ncbi:hypothetical protein [Saccharopolyspora hattusasensis]|uniref:hypothetical protein n=1 Tax=Saccharopolyspora hattusasensis TaxID=1128679 RepID=UPI003D9683DC
MLLRPPASRAVWCYPALLSALIALAGCGEPPANPPNSAPASPPAAQVAGTEVTLRGEVRTGVELGCLVLNTSDREYLLVHPPPELRPGVIAVVRGRIEPGMVTTCMQGTPLVVSEAHTA